MARAADRIPTLLDEVVRSSHSPFGLGPSTGDDGAGSRGLGASIGDDGAFNVLGASVGDDGGPLNALGSSIGDDGGPFNVLGVSIGDDGVVISDRRLKTDVAVVGSTVLGLPLYRYRYVGHDAVYEGVMAQDVLAAMPEAVLLGADGFYRVRYDRLGIACRRIG
jgi:hypothetical protein